MPKNKLSNASIDEKQKIVETITGQYLESHSRFLQEGKFSEVIHHVTNASTLMGFWMSHLLYDCCSPSKYCWWQPEIPRPTTWDVYSKTLKIMGSTTISTGFFRIFEPSTGSTLPIDPSEKKKKLALQASKCPWRAARCKGVTGPWSISAPACTFASPAATPGKVKEGWKDGRKDGHPLSWWIQKNTVDLIFWYLRMFSLPRIPSEVCRGHDELPTQTKHYHKGNPPKLPYICIVRSPKIGNLMTPVVVEMFQPL